MSWFFLLKGVLIGLSISAPVGPMGLLCIRRSLAWGRSCGIVTGLGVATADLCYSGVAAFGLAAISGILVAHGGWFRFIGGLVLLLMGVRIFLSKPPSESGSADRSLAQTVSLYSTAYASALALALSNPVGIVFFTSVFSGMGLAETGGSLFYAGCLTFGVFCGSLLWWITLSSIVAFLGKRLTQAVLVRVNQLSGLLIAGFGILILARAW